ncbi:HAMP domain-containing sensor histidine kinase [Desulfosporosinus youngiae]|uniref:Heme sensor protein HssS n=1 Tax=Desulfosporosinus youngiae DSM 17734 TaxID=768710 RepID=H5Y605_9FIRM|nr:HAMP domain-containing sensor histidine kinase [Desulfosporosinus youngiae]EHQ90944.1 signal transduction histidine kinase [Desulfosporosinus youngiae DSM 17734]
MIKTLSNSIRAKGTLIAIGILFFSCLVSFALMTLLFLVLFHGDLSISEAHSVFGRFMFVTLILCVALGGSLLYFAIRKISDPIIRISNAAKEVAKGDFSIKMDYKSNDELGILVQNFNLMTTELGNMEYLRKDFISSVSHEFKTPLASIQGFAEMLQDKDLSEDDFQAYTTIIIEETKRLSHLSSNMLRLSKLDHQFIPERTKSFSLDEQIRRTIVLLEEKWSKKNLELNIDLDEIVYTGDEDLIQQIWLNLIENAVKFSAESGTIFIQAKKTPDMVVAEIKDQGVGISNIDQGRIFEKFFQGDKSHSKEGSGLGLAIVKKIVEIYDGDISFTSEIGQGTTFVVKLPLKKRES